MKYAVIVTGGKQYQVKEGELLNIEKLPVEESQEYVFNQVLMIGDAGQVQLGKPYLAGATVTAQVVKQFKDDKIKIVKFKRRKHYMRVQGHRQRLTQVKIGQILQ